MRLKIGFWVFLTMFVASLGLAYLYGREVGRGVYSTCKVVYPGGTVWIGPCDEVDTLI